MGHKKAFKPISILLFCCTMLSFDTHAQNHTEKPVFNHVFLSVSDIDSSISFYTTAFNLRVTQRFEHLEISQQDKTDTLDVKIAFLKFPEQDFVYELSERFEDTALSSGLFQHVGIEVDNIKAVSNRLIEVGAEPIISTRHIKTDGALEIKQAFFRGPDGEQIEIIEVLKGEY